MLLVLPIALRISSLSKRCLKPATPTISEVWSENSILLRKDGNLIYSWFIEHPDIYGDDRNIYHGGSSGKSQFMIWLCLQYPKKYFCFPEMVKAQDLAPTIVDAMDQGWLSEGWEGSCIFIDMQKQQENYDYFYQNLEKLRNDNLLSGKYKGYRARFPLNLWLFFPIECLTLKIFRKIDGGSLRFVKRTEAAVTIATQWWKVAAKVLIYDQTLPSLRYVNSIAQIGRLLTRTRITRHLLPKNKERKNRHLQQHYQVQLHIFPPSSMTLKRKKTIRFQLSQYMTLEYDTLCFVFLNFSVFL